MHKNLAWLRELALLVGIILLALMVRKYLLPIHTLDYDKFISKWYNFIKNHGEIRALKYNFSDYNEPYLYLLVLVTHLPLLEITAVKAISIFFDFVLATFVYLIVRIKHENPYHPIFAALIVLFLPTIFINSALWAQSDSIYTAFSLGGLYFLLRKKPFWACVFFGIAFAFKLQAIFLFPLLFVLWITKEIRFRYFLVIPLIYVLAIFPAYLIGRNFVDMLTLYMTQANYLNPLSMSSPGLFELIRVPLQQTGLWKHVGVFLALAAVLILSFVILASKRKLTNETLLRLALIFALCMPFLLPEMHERYFYLADVLSLIYAFYFPKYFYLAIVVQLCSLESYMPFFTGSLIIEMPYLSLAILGIITMTIYGLMKTLWPAEQPTLKLLSPSPIQIPLEHSTVSHLSSVGRLSQDK